MMRQLKSTGVLQELKKFTFQAKPQPQGEGEPTHDIIDLMESKAPGSYKVYRRFDFQGKKLPTELGEPIHDISDLRVEDGFLKLSSTGGDPYYTLQGLNIPAKKVNAIAIQARFKSSSSRPVAHFRIYFETDYASGFSEQRKLVAKVQTDETLRTFFLYPSRASGWKGTITRLRVNPVESERTVAIREIALLKLVGAAPVFDKFNFKRRDLPPEFGEPINDILNLRVEDGFLKFRSAGGDPHFTLRGLQIPAAQVSVIAVRALFDPHKGKSISQFRIYFETDSAPGFSEKRMLFTNVQTDGTLRTFLFYPGRDSGWKGTITRLRVGPVMSKNEVAIQEIALFKSPGHIDFSILGLQTKGVSRTWIAQKLQNVVFSSFFTSVEWTIELPCEPEFHAQFALPGIYRYLDWQSIQVLVEVKDSTGKRTPISHLSFEKSMGERIFQGVDLKLALDRWSGQRITIYLRAHETEPNGNSGGLLYWINPLVSSRSSSPKRPNIVLISIDTLRADHLSLYGYRRRTSPNIDAWAKKGITFSYAISQAPWTLPSHASLFTSLYPSQHQAILGKKNVGIEKMSLSSSFETLAERIQQNGYVTAGFAGGGNVSWQVNLDQGFDYWFQPFQFSHHFPQVTEWLEQHESERFFLFLHTYEVHDYHSQHMRDNSHTRAATFYPDYQGKVLDKDFNPKDHKEPKKYNKTTGLDYDDVRFLEAMYDVRIIDVDKELGRLFDYLSQRGLDENTVVIVTSDHGEEFNEHGSLYHGHSLYDEMIRVPLIIRYPKKWPQGQTIARQVSLTDLYPTILELTGTPVPEGLEGESLLHLMRRKGNEQQQQRSAFSENPRRVLSGIRTQSAKYIYRGGERLAFDLVKDPFEKNPDAPPPVLQQLVAIHDKMIAKNGGYHFLARGSRLDGCPISLTTDGHFITAIPRFTETLDILEASKKRIDLTFTLKDKDVDGLYFLALPTSEPVKVTMCGKNGEAGDSIEVSLGANGPVRLETEWTLGREVPKEVVTVLSPPIQDPTDLQTEMALWNLETSPAVDDGKDQLPSERKDEFLRRLRSLGYLE
jgi:arylsulfatase A-like enzyme